MFELIQFVLKAQRHKQQILTIQGQHYLSVEVHGIEDLI